jgi:hypothetical protein
MPWANDGGSSWNATKCSPVAPDPKQPGEECTVEGNAVSGVDDCEAAAMCWNVDPETNMGYCVAFCMGSEVAPICAAPCHTCPLSGNGVLILCLPTCDPLAPGCRENEVCVPAPGGDAFMCAIDASGEEGQYRDPCEYINACDPGLLCVNATTVPDCPGAVGCCTPFCDPEAADPGCPDTGLGMECVPFYEDDYVPPCSGPVGVCTLPG